MREQIIYSMKAPYREDFRIKGYSFGKGMKSACILGPIRGNEIQQMYICSQLVKALRELERIRISTVCFREVIMKVLHRGLRMDC